MGEAKSRGNYEDRRDQALSRMVEEAEVLVALRVTDGKVVLSSLSRDEPADQNSPAVAVAAFLNANWTELVGQALALHTSWLAGAAEMRPDLQDGMVVLRPQAEDPTPVILAANGGVLTRERAENPRIELPASVAQEQFAAGGGGDFGGGGAEASFGVPANGVQGVDGAQGPDGTDLVSTEGVPEPSEQSCRASDYASTDSSSGSSDTGSSDTSSGGE